MGILNMACRAVAIIAFPLICLSGCGGGSNNGGAASTTITTVPTTPATTVPDTTSSVAAVGGTNKVTVSWNAVSGATSYTIYWSATIGVTTATGTVIATSSTSYIHRGLLPAATYYYIVTAQNSSGESGASGQVFATTSTVDGSALYATYCGQCHGRLAISDVTNAGVTEITAALQNVGNMTALALSDSQIATISAALMYNK